MQNKTIYHYFLYESFGTYKDEDGLELTLTTGGSGTEKYSYTYDENGNIISVKDVQSQSTTYEYTDNDLTKQILPSGAALTYTYDDYHNVKTATSDTGVVYNFAYDTNGNNTSVSIVSGSVNLTSTAEYTADGNRLSSTTDAAGKVTTYSTPEQSIPLITCTVWPRLRQMSVPAAR